MDIGAELNLGPTELTGEQLKLIGVVVERVRATPATRRGKWLALLARTVNGLVANGITTVRASEVHRAMVAIAPADPLLRTPNEIGKDLAARGFNFPTNRDANTRWFVLREVTREHLLRAILASKIAD